MEVFFMGSGRKDTHIVRAVSAVIHDSSDRVLLARRSSNKKLDPGLWETIGGNIERNETAEEAIVRKIREEIGNKIVLKNL